MYIILDKKNKAPPIYVTEPLFLFQNYFILISAKAVKNLSFNTLI